MLIAVRVVVVTTLLLAALIIQYTVRELLPINYLYTTAGVTYALTLLYIGAAQLIASRKLNLAVQTAGHYLKEAIESGLDNGREMYTLTVGETLRHLHSVLVEHNAPKDVIPNLEAVPA